MKEMSEKEVDSFLDELYDIDINGTEDLEKVKELFNKHGILYTFDYDCAFDSPGCDVYYYAFAFVINGEPHLFSDTITYC